MNQGLLAPDPASHVIWWVGFAFLGLLVLFVVLDAARSLRYWWRNRHLSPEPETDPARRFRLGAPQGPLFTRFVRAVQPRWRTWLEGRVNPPPR